LSGLFVLTGLRKRIDNLPRQYRSLDTEIQAKNWTAELLEWSVLIGVIKGMAQPSVFECLAELRGLFSEMISIVANNARKDLSYQINEMNRAICLIDSLTDGRRGSGDVFEEICSICKNLYPARGGLSEFYIWDDDSQKRIAINEPIGQINDRIWKLVNDEDTRREMSLFTKLSGGKNGGGSYGEQKHAS
jgi:hypothetical protein